jgi:dsRNA-specific ribonuclease
MIATHFQPLLDEGQGPSLYQDYKSRLQERVQLKNEPIPSYEVIEECGPDHDKTFKVQLTALDISTEGVGKSKKLAEQDAARKALKTIAGRLKKAAENDRASD